MSRAPATIWLTGPPASGKTVLGALLARSLGGLGLAVVHLDGYLLERELWPEARTTPEGRREAVRRAAALAGLLNAQGVWAVAGVASPLAADRALAREAIPRFVEVFLDAALEQRLNRDSRGLVRLGLTGGPGAEPPHEPPAHPEVYCRTDRETPEESLGRVLEHLGLAGLPEGGGGAERAYTPEEEALVTKRLKDLGYL